MKYGSIRPSPLQGPALRRRYTGHHAASLSLRHHRILPQLPADPMQQWHAASTYARSTSDPAADFPDVVCLRFDWAASDPSAGVIVVVT